MQSRTLTLAIAIAAALGACSTQAPTNEPEAAVDVAAVEEAAHGGYVAAINSNDIGIFADIVTDDVVYQYPGAPELVGREAVLEWVRGYLEAYQTEWDKTSINFTVSGEWAFERYTYRSRDTDRTTGEVIEDTGKGINIYRRGSDGKWRVAIDGWSSDNQ